MLAAEIAAFVMKQLLPTDVCKIPINVILVWSASCLWELGRIGGDTRRRLVGELTVPSHPLYIMGHVSTWSGRDARALALSPGSMVRPSRLPAATQKGEGGHLQEPV